MRSYIDLSGPSAVEYLFARNVEALAKRWDGGCELVGYVLIESDQPPRVGFWTRDVAAEELQRRAPRFPDPHALHAIAAALLEGPRPSRVQCVLIAGALAVLAEIEPDDLREPSRYAAPISDDDVARMLERCRTREGAESALSEARLLYLAETGLASTALEALEDAVTHRWDDLGALQLAVNAAREANNKELPTPAGQRVRFVLTMVGQVVLDRATAEVNAPGGSA